MRTTRRVHGTPKATTDQAARQQLVEQVAGGIVGVGAEARGLKSAGDELGTLADEAGRQAQTVAAASELTSGVMDNVAGAAEELSSSLREVSQRTTLTSAAVEQAVADTGEAQAAMAALDSSCQAIQEVSRMIASVARQTNLLALNATIEAARAGAAGSGFAVVAGEVKELSTQTATATEQIDKNVRVLMDDAQRSARSIGGIAATVRQIGEMAVEVAAAVEEQSTVTAEIARNVADAASNSGGVSQAIAALNQVVAATNDRVRGVRRLTHRLVDGSAELNASLLGYLKGEIREQAVVGTSTAERLKAAVAAHGAWKARLMEVAVTGVSNFDPAVVGSDDKCPLGVWLYQDCSPQERKSSYYNRIREMHARFHELAGRILQQAVDGRRREAEEAVAFGGPFDSLSAELVGTINGWRDELNAA